VSNERLDARQIVQAAIDLAGRLEGKRDETLLEVVARLRVGTAKLTNEGMGLLLQEIYGAHIAVLGMIRDLALMTQRLQERGGPRRNE